MFLFLVELFTFSTRAFSKLYFLFFWTFPFSTRAFAKLHCLLPLSLLIKTYTSSASTRKKITINIKRKSKNHVIVETRLSSWSKSFNQKGFIVLFKIGLQRFINKLFFKNNLILLKSTTKLLKSSMFMAQLHCNRWSHIADCFIFLRHSPLRLEITCVPLLWCKIDKRFFCNT